MRSIPIALLPVAVFVLPVSVASAQATANEAVAIVDGHTISRADLETRIQGKLLKLRTEEYDVEFTALDQWVNDLLIAQEADRRQVSVDGLLNEEVYSKVQPVSDAEAQAVLDESRDKYAKISPEQALKSIAASIRRRRTDNLRSALVARLRSQHPFRIQLEQPRLQDLIPGGHSTGPDAAPVEIVEFSDFQCPFCAKLRSALDRVRNDYGDRIRLTYKQFPLPSHPQAGAAAEASLCAAAQGKFWEMHDELFAEQRLVSEEAFAEIAKRAGLDLSSFDACLSAHDRSGELAADKADAASLGIGSTPTFFINGRMFVGSKSYEALRDIVDSELRQSGVQRARLP